MLLQSETFRARHCQTPLEFVRQHAVNVTVLKEMLPRKRPRYAHIQGIIAYTDTHLARWSHISIQLRHRSSLSHMVSVMLSVGFVKVQCCTHITTLHVAHSVIAHAAVGHARASASSHCELQLMWCCACSPSHIVCQRGPCAGCSRAHRALQLRCRSWRASAGSSEANWQR